ncbi:MAG TPA: FAD-binding oxidoreductase [Chloroflexota bacterium]|nr:FAD-binding oxidoreductase [Chloroflexota bacterium]
MSSEMIATGAHALAVGAICPVAAEDERPRYAVDGQVPAVVAFPRAPEEVGRLVALAGEHGWAVTPWGGGTHMALGDRPRRVDLVICTTGLADLVEYQPANLTCTVQAGVRLPDLQRVLREQGQMLPLDPPKPEQATVGGLIACNSSGPARARYGTCRDVLIGIQVVNDAGTLTRAGGRVVKNVTGYDLCKLYTGSLGTLGIITEATFKVWPLRERESTVLASYRELAPAWETVRALFRAGLPVHACELLLPSASEGRGYLLAIRLGGGQASLNRQKADVTTICSAGFPPQQTRAIEIVEGDTAPDFWQSLASYGWAEHDLVARVSAPPASLGQLLAALPRDAIAVAHALSGVAYVYGLGRSVLADVVAQVQNACLVLEQCSPWEKAQGSVWGPVGPEFALMRRVKEQFDPRGIFNPGRFVGGL